VGVPKLYLETTTFNFYHLEKDSEKKRDAVGLFKRIAEGEFKPYTSIVAIDELPKATAGKYQKMIGLLTEYNIEVLTSDFEARKLADIYVSKKIIPLKYYNDAMHIAIATVNGLNFVVSYNFGHIVKLKTLNMAGLVNIRRDYPQIGLFSPTEVKDDDGR
jgi:predicted nucleic acid-binding protein